MKRVGLVLLLTFISVISVAQTSPTSSSNGLLLGVAWYPEHWPEQRWEQDLALMEAANIHVVRVAEFRRSP